MLHINRTDTNHLINKNKENSCQGWCKKKEKWTLKITGLLTSDEQRHEIAVQIDNYNTECSPSGRTNYANLP